MDRNNSDKTRGNLPQLLVVVLLVVGAYMLGSLKTKVEFLEKGGGGAAAAPVAGAPAAPAAPAAPLEAANVPKPSADDWVRGNRNATFALIEYSDLECPFCKSFHPTAKSLLEENKDVMWVYRHYPLSFHVNAQKQSEASECAGELGGNDAFWKYIDAIYERTTSNGTGFALDKLVPLAVEQGLNEAQFKTCLDSGKHAQRVKDQMDKGTTAGITGTPGNVVLNVKSGKTRLIPGAVPLDQIKPVLEELK